MYCKCIFYQKKTFGYANQGEHCAFLQIKHHGFVRFSPQSYLLYRKHFFYPLCVARKPS